jgi:hypothetical protein
MASMPVAGAQITRDKAPTDSCASNRGVTMTFEEDAKIQQIAEAYALDAIDFAKNSFSITLDWSDGSVAHIEDILVEMYKQKAKAKPTEEAIWTFSKMLGSYVGEVYRRNHGAAWGLVVMGDEKMPGLQSKSCKLFWPWGKVSNRLTNGPEDNVWHYYQALLPERSS